ncbi:MAG TPA: hypothetical protein DGG94_10630 [Micromonosporaceae bacterium]|nr:hypothetical protein [Micromonosporaceae bacterium]HCU50235.1 hypothetical protein [Micromonosporaceae bacterium]
MAQDTTAARSAPLLGSGTGTQVFLGLLWLGITVWTTHATITTSQDGPSGALGSAAEALPGIVATTMVTSASIASAAASRSDRAIFRLLIGLIAGSLFGLIVAYGLRFAYGSEPSISVLAITVGLASVVGGVAAIFPNAVLEAALWAVSWVFFASLILGVLQPQAMKLLGGGPAADVAAQATANTRFIYAAAAIAGWLAGVHAYRSLRTESFALPWYVIAGALPGMILLASEALTTFGGASLVSLVHGFSADDGPPADLSSFARVRDALIVLGVGSFVSLIGGARAIRESKKESALA